MQFLLLVKASPKAEASTYVDEALRKQMDDYNDALESAGVKIMAKGLRPSHEAVRLSYLNPGQEPELSYGPFPYPKEQIAGFFILECNSFEEAVDWLKKAPDPQGYGEGQIELRQIR